MKARFNNYEDATDYRKDASNTTSGKFSVTGETYTLLWRKSTNRAKTWKKYQWGLQKIDPDDELLMLRVRTKANEVLITPDGKITVMVVQNAQDRIQL
ncbi:unnamed protein product [Ceratitis capitata]|uniref:(Mediterranean fruit fly) hypothetical protein n=1 Tax=Ceratitis capitata TaxID=7213 RepID=A0A811V8V3_CERCA|nr:unnamed protein product [Ceratitis capitata]